MAANTGPVASMSQLEAEEIARVNAAQRFAAYKMLAWAL